MTKIQDEKGGAKFYLNAQEDVDEKKKNRLNGFSVLSVNQNGSESDVVPESPELKKLKLESNIFPISVVDKDWNYRGEGGANLVISLSDEKQIIRFSKSKYPEKDHEAKILEIAFYANEVMRTALGHHYVRPLSIGIVSDTDFDHVRLEAQQFRPLERCKKDIMSHRVIVSPDCVFLTTDYLKNTFGDTFSVEIKPKQGWHSEKSTCAVDLCSRCLKQFAKLKQGKIDRISRYCPLDLFSGDRYRMKRAVFDLFENPHNRFKIYKNGDLIYTENKGDPSTIENELRKWLIKDQDAVSDKEDLSGLHHLAALLCTVLLSNYDPSSDDHTSDDILSKDISVDEDLIDLQLDEKSPLSKPRRLSCDTTSEGLPQGCILESVLSLQQHAHISDHDAKVFCEKLLNNIDDLERLHQLILWHPMTIPEKVTKSVLELKLQGLSGSEIEALQQLQRFLLSVSAKDVSLLITFRQVLDPLLEPEIRLPLVRLRGRDFRVMISVIDLDPKPVHRIANWVKRKEEWLQIYRQNTKPNSKTGSDPKCQQQVVNTKQEDRPEI